MFRNQGTIFFAKNSKGKWPALLCGINIGNQSNGQSLFMQGIAKRLESLRHLQSLSAKNQFAYS